MAEYNAAVLTDKGKDLIRNILLCKKNEKKLTQMGAVISTEEIKDTQTAEKLEQLSSENFIKEIDKYDLCGENTSQFFIKLQFNNAGLQEARNLNTIGFYAGDGTENSEVLFAVKTVKTLNTNTIPAEKLGNLINFSFKEIFSIGQGELRVENSFDGYAEKAKVDKVGNIAVLTSEGNFQDGGKSINDVLCNANAYTEEKYKSLEELIGKKLDKTGCEINDSIAISSREEDITLTAEKAVTIESYDGPVNIKSGSGGIGLTGQGYIDIQSGSSGVKMEGDGNVNIISSSKNIILTVNNDDSIISLNGAVHGSCTINGKGVYDEDVRVFSPNNMPSTVTKNEDGLMSAEDKLKLDGISTGATVNIATATTSVNGLMSAEDKKKLDDMSELGSALPVNLAEVISKPEDNLGGTEGFTGVKTKWYTLSYNIEKACWRLMPIVKPEGGITGVIKI
ncbi:MAG: hypothetical protein LBR74_05720 [Eubacterium sp.]|jgi:hypothetical protein|nr:hypothetical protein [Eubacterium sp.]